MSGRPAAKRCLRNAAPCRRSARRRSWAATELSGRTRAIGAMTARTVASRAVTPGLAIRCASGRRVSKADRPRRSPWLDAVRARPARTGIVVGASKSLSLIRGRGSAVGAADSRRPLLNAEPSAAATRRLPGRQRPRLPQPPAQIACQWSSMALPRARRLRQRPVSVKAYRCPTCPTAGRSIRSRSRERKRGSRAC